MRRPLSAPTDWSTPSDPVNAFLPLSLWLAQDERRKHSASLDVAFCVMSPFPWLGDIQPFHRKCPQFIQRKHWWCGFWLLFDGVKHNNSIKCSAPHEHEGRHLLPQLPPIYHSCLWEDAFFCLRTRAGTADKWNWYWMRCISALPLFHMRKKMQWNYILLSGLGLTAYDDRT